MSDDGNGNGKYQPVPPEDTRWKPGQSGNPRGRVAGRPPKWFNQPRVVRDLAREHTKEAIETLVQAMRTSKDMKVRCAAAVALLDRGWGKPIETLQRTDFRMAPIAIVEPAEEPEPDAADEEPSPTENGQ